jgi:hypothetical protein
MLTVYPDFRRDGFLLEHAIKMVELYPQSFSIPTAEQRYGLREGDVVKLSFRFVAPDEMPQDYDIERMWVVVQRREADHWIGRLDNDPRFHSGIRSGHEFHFHSDHVIDIWRDDKV